MALVAYNPSLASLIFPIFAVGRIPFPGLAHICRLLNGHVNLKVVNLVENTQPFVLRRRHLWDVGPQSYEKVLHLLKNILVTLCTPFDKAPIKPSNLSAIWPYPTMIHIARPMLGRVPPPRCRQCRKSSSTRSLASYQWWMAQSIARG